MPAEGRTGTIYTITGGGGGAGTVVSAISASNATFTGTVRITGGPNITVGTDASGITMSAAAGGGGGGVAIAGSNTTFTSGTVVFTGSNAATVKSNAGGIVVDVPTQTTQTQNLHNLTLSGNTAGVMAQVSSGTVTLAGGNNVTISQAGNAITISGANTHAQQTGISSVGASNTTYTSGGITFTGSNMVTVRSTTGQGIVIDATQTVQTQNVAVPAASNTTYTSGTYTITGVGGGVTVSSNTGQRIDISVAAPVAQTAQTQNLHNVTLSGNTAGVMAQVSSGTMTLAGGNNITLSQAGNAITISGANAGGAQTAISSIGVSNTTYTSGGVTITGSNMVTVRSTTGQGIVVDATQTVQTQNVVVPAASNTTYTSGTFTITGVGGGVTVISNTGQRIDISVAAPVAQTVQPGIQAVSAGTQTATTGTVVFSNANNVTFGLSSGASTSIMTASASYPAGASATGNLGAVIWSNQTVTSGSITVTGSNAATVKSAAGPTLVVDVPTQTVQPGVQAISAGTQTATTGTVVFSNANNVSFGISSGASTSILTASASFPAQTAQTGISSIGASNTTYTSGGVTFTGSNIVTVRSTTGQGIVIDASTSQSVQTQGIVSLGVSTGGNTSGNTAVNTGSQFVLAGGNNVTLSQSTAAGATTVTISAAAGGGAGYSAGASNLGNTAGSTGATGTRLALVGSNNITLSQSTDANGGTVSIIGAGGGAGQYSMGVSNLGNTAGATGLTGTQGVLVGSSGITLSQTTGANGGTVTIQGPGAWAVPNISFYDSPSMVGSATSMWRAPATAQNTWFFFPLTPPNDVFPGNMTPGTIRMDISGSNTVSTTSTAAFSLTVSLAIYTRNGSYLSIVNSATTSIGSAANASISSWYHGFRWLTWHSSQFSSAPAFSQTNYWGAVAFSRAGEAKLLSMLGGQLNAVGSVNRSGLLGVGSSTGSSTMLEYPYLGILTASSASPPASVSKGDIAHPANTNSVNFIPHFVFDNIGVLD